MTWILVPRAAWPSQTAGPVARGTSCSEDLKFDWIESNKGNPFRSSVFKSVCHREFETAAMFGLLLLDSVQSKRLERYEATVKELAILKWRYKNNLLRWTDEGKENRSKRCSNSPVLGLKKAHSKTVGSTANTSLRQIKLKIPPLYSGFNLSTPQMFWEHCWPLL